MKNYVNEKQIKVINKVKLSNINQSPSYMAARGSQNWGRVREMYTNFLEKA
jgi:hypothetical protein